MSEFYMVCRRANSTETWEETVSLMVPTTQREKRQWVKRPVDEPVQAAKATIDFFNATLQGPESAREIVEVFELKPDGNRLQLWSGVYPCAEQSKQAAGPV